MRINDREVTLLLTQDGREVLRAARLNFPESELIRVQVAETDEMGLWIKVQRGEEDHLVLLHWNYVLTMDVVAGHSLIGMIKT